MLPPWRLARARLARAAQDGRPAAEIAELRRAYRAKQSLCDLLASDLAPNDSQRRELVFVLVAGGDVDGAA